MTKKDPDLEKTKREIITAWQRLKKAVKNLAKEMGLIRKWYLEQ